MKVTFKQIWALSLLCMHSLAHAQPTEPLTHLNELAKAFVVANTTLENGDRLEVQLSQGANELQVSPCSSTIDVSLPPNATFDHINTLVMHCTGPEAWQVYVPVTTHVFTKVLVAKQPIPSNEIIDEAMLTYGEQDKNQLYSGYFKDMNAVLGQVSSGTIATGSVLTKHNVSKPILIHQNQNVAIIAQKGAILVKAEGIAKSDGALNDTIKVYNPSSKRMIDGIVISGSSIEAL
jgi:flagella basal body P-ring formation protein FlgA